jgi:hypothetical protein
MSEEIFEDRSASFEVPPPPESAGANPSWADNSRAKSEEKNWNNEQKLKDATEKNSLRYIKVIGYIVPIFMIMASILFISAIAVWAVHILTPIEFLKPEQLSKIQSILFSGSLGAVISSYAHKHILKTS